MKAIDKEFEMQRFIKGETQIMVATTRRRKYWLILIKLLSKEKEKKNH